MVQVLLSLLDFYQGDGGLIGSQVGFCPSGGESSLSLLCLFKTLCSVSYFSFLPCNSIKDYHYVSFLAEHPN